MLINFISSYRIQERTQERIKSHTEEGKQLENLNKSENSVILKSDLHQETFEYLNEILKKKKQLTTIEVQVENQEDIKALTFSSQRYKDIQQQNNININASIDKFMNELDVVYTE